MFEHYKKSTDLMGTPSFNDLLAEVEELIEDKSLEELSDVLHTICRILRLPSRIAWVVARPTAMKHAQRMVDRGCPRSARNCKAAGRDCCCGGKGSKH
jgi:hypothetical protein